PILSFFFISHDTPPTHIYTLSLHDALPILSSDRGLAGGLNINLFKKVVKHVQQQQEQSIEVQFALIGQKAVSFFKNYGGKVLGRSEEHTSELQSRENLVCRLLLEKKNKIKI